MPKSSIDHSSPVIFSSLAESPLQQLLDTEFVHSKKVIIVDENTNEFCLEYLLTSITGLEYAEVMMLPAGEENKVLEICFQVWEALTEYGIGRKDLIINLGGGVVTDTGGFIAAVFKRGVPFLHIPTSLLGMVDAAIGGKTGIDLGPYKNQLGTFSMPEMTIVDTAFLGTLPQEEVLNGFAEMVKHALIADIELWNAFLQLERIEANELMPFIEKSAAIKMQIVTEDPTEAGQRKLLNFGHTVGHALEGCFLSTETPISHGLAVVLGMIAEIHLSVELGYLSSHDQELIVSSLKKWFPLINIPMFENEQVIQLMKNDKKNSENKIKAALLKKTGKGIFDQISTDEGILSALDYLRQHIN
jgi:3-dehydroquinate synthase